MAKKQFIVRLLDALAILAGIATFTPLVMPEHKLLPSLLGIPYTMWVSFLLSIFFVMLAYLVSRINKKESHAD